MRLIDADALMKEFAKFVRASNNSDFAPIPTWNNAVSLTESAPTVDAVEVVRCKDCEHWKKITDRHGVCIHANGVMSEIDFCSYGLRRRSE